MYDLNGVYHEKADVGGIPKMWLFLSFEGFKSELLASCQSQVKIEKISATFLLLYYISML